MCFCRSWVRFDARLAQRARRSGFERAHDRESARVGSGRRFPRPGRRGCPERKATARSFVARALNESSWGSKSGAFRVNALNTPHFYRDLIEVVEAAAD